MLDFKKIAITCTATAFAAFVVLTAVPAQAETLRLVTNWGPTIYSVEETLRFVEEFNNSEAAKAADISIVHAGGPEVTPATEQLTGLSAGVFDMLFGAAGYYVGTVPEAYALYGTSATPMEARESGAIELLDKIYSEKANAHVLGWLAGGVGYHIWLKDEPKLDEKGLPDLKDVKIRSSGFYNAWLSKYGATTVTVPAPDIYNALERGVVDGAAWPGLGILDFGFHKFIGYRIDPPVWQFDNLLWINLDKWNGLTDDQRKALSDAVIAYEPNAYEFYQNLAAEERAKVEEEGVKPFTLGAEAEEEYVSHARSVHWEQVKEKAPDNYDALRAVLPE